MSVTDVSKELPTELVGNTVLDYGDQALMLQCGSTAEVMAWAAALHSAALPGVVDVVPAARTVLVKLDGPRHQGVVRQRLRKMRVDADEVAVSEVAVHDGLAGRRIGLVRASRQVHCRSYPQQ